MHNTTHNIWGWGLQERFPSRQERAQLGVLLGALLQTSPPTPKDPTPQEHWQLPHPRISIPNALQNIASSDPITRASHTYGKNFADLVRGFRGDFRSAPDLVITPRSEDDVRKALSWAEDTHTALVPFGGGTSVVSGVECPLPDHCNATASLDMRAMSALRSLDLESHIAHIEAGATGPHIEDHLRPHGFTLRHYPQSFEFSTLGGWIATRAGGHFATRETHIDDFTVAAHMMTPQGDFITPLLPASGAGPDPIQTVLGSEGTLGVITSAWMRVRPRPTYTSRATLLFNSFQEGCKAAQHIVQSGLSPSNCRLLDRREATLHQVHHGTHHVLLLAFESHAHPTEPLLQQALSVAQDLSGKLATPPRHTTPSTQSPKRPKGASSTWRSAFLDSPYLFNSLVSLGITVDTFETACTWTQLPTLHNAIRSAAHDAIQEMTGHRGLLSCRLTHVYPDGAAPYYTFIAPPCDRDPIDVWHTIKQRVSDAIVQNQGTITHHHAVGRLHKPHHLQSTPDLHRRALQSVKATLDPNGILNPGALIDPK